MLSPLSAHKHPDIITRCAHILSFLSSSQETLLNIVTSCSLQRSLQCARDGLQGTYPSTDPGNLSYIIFIYLYCMAKRVETELAAACFMQQCVNDMVQHVGLGHVHKQRALRLERLCGQLHVLKQKGRPHLANPLPLFCWEPNICRIQLPHKGIDVAIGFPAQRKQTISSNPVSVKPVSNEVQHEHCDMPL